MDHDEAVRLQAAVKYVLGELPRGERDSFEEHYFDCGECALDVRSAVAFADNARNVFCHEAREAALQAPAPAGGRWLGWLKPIVAVPAFAVLLMIIAYQNFVTIPDARSVPKELAVQNPVVSNPVVFGSVFPLHALDGRRGGEVSTSEMDKIQVKPDEGFALRLDFAPEQVFESYIGRLRDASDREVFHVTVRGTSTNQRVQLVVPPKVLKPGTYSLIFAGDPGAKGLGNGGEVLHYSFSVAFQQ